VFPLEIHYV